MNTLQLLAFFLVLVPSSQAATSCHMSGMAWDNDMECTGAGVAVALTSGIRTAKSCVMIAMAGQAGDPNRMCISAVGCGDTDSADCKCSIHCACTMGSKTGTKSCIQKPAANAKECSAATCTASTETSAAAQVASNLGSIFISIAGVFCSMSLLY